VSSSSALTDALKSTVLTVPPGPMRHPLLASDYPLPARTRPSRCSATTPVERSVEWLPVHGHDETRAKQDTSVEWKETVMNSVVLVHGEAFSQPPVAMSG
jgi:hypothetical protein